MIYNQDVSTLTYETFFKDFFEYSLFGNETVVSVSYTHLDVYKRQI